MAFPVDDKFIINAEGELGVRFPESFRLKMMKNNGGGVKVVKDSFQLHPFFDTSEKKRIKRTCNSIVHETKTARQKYRLPSNLVVIGKNGGGDSLVYRIQEKGTIDPIVYWLNHETEELVFIANDFNELEVIA